MSFAIHGLGTAHPPDALTPDDGLRLARFLAGPDVRTSTWLGPVYASSGAHRRFQVIGGRVVQDIFDGSNNSGSPFFPTSANDGVGPTTAERMHMYAEEAGPLAVRAATAAVAEAGFAPESFTHLVTISCTGFVAPGVDLALIRGLGLRPTVERTHVGFMGCHGALNGLRVANAFTTANPQARVLLCAVELCSLHYYYGNQADKLIANAIFADGAAAVVGASGELERGGALVACGDPFSPSPVGSASASPPTSPQRGEVGRVGPSGELCERAEATPLPAGERSAKQQRRETGEGTHTPHSATAPERGAFASWRLAASGSCLIPDSESDMGWTVGDHGFEMSLSRKVPGLIARHLRPWLEGWLSDNGLSLDAVGTWAGHPGGPKILSAVEEGLGLALDALAVSRAVYAEYGNMSSPTILFILDRLRKANAPRPCVALGFGPGLVAEAALFV